MNNLDYQRTLYLMNQTPLVDVELINIIKAKACIHPSPACMYNDMSRLKTLHPTFRMNKDNLHAWSGKGYLDFGKSQQQDYQIMQTRWIPWNLF